MNARRSRLKRKFKIHTDHTALKRIFFSAIERSRLIPPMPDAPTRRSQADEICHRLFFQIGRRSAKRPCNVGNPETSPSGTPFFIEIFPVNSVGQPDCTLYEQLSPRQSVGYTVHGSVGADPLNFLSPTLTYQRLQMGKGVKSGRRSVLQAGGSSPTEVLPKRAASGTYSANLMQDRRRNRPQYAR